MEMIKALPNPIVAENNYYNIEYMRFLTILGKWVDTYRPTRWLCIKM